MAQGTIIKALSGYYYVNADDKVWQCRGRGILRKQGVSPLVGDRVDVSYTDHDEGLVDVIHDRKNELIRPPIANVDLVTLVFSVEEPAFSSTLLDKFLVHIERAGIEAMLCLTKTDLSEDKTEHNHDAIDEIKNVYEPLGYTVIVTSSKNGKGVDELLTMLTHKTSVFAGQSGVGKSSLLNAMIPQLNLETAAISMKLGRGKHTTRHVELIPLPTGGFIADTPGFSQLDFAGIEPESLSSYFVEIGAKSESCKFRRCSHTKEPGCAVILAVEDGEINRERYDHYVHFYNEIKEQSRRQYK